jgi:hypothetical protein
VHPVFQREHPWIQALAADGTAGCAKCPTCFLAMVHWRAELPLGLLELRFLRETSGFRECYCAEMVAGGAPASAMSLFYRLSPGFQLAITVMGPDSTASSELFTRKRCASEARRRWTGPGTRADAQAASEISESLHVVSPLGLTSEAPPDVLWHHISRQIPGRELPAKRDHKDLQSWVDPDLGRFKARKR